MTGCPYFGAFASKKEAEVRRSNIKMVLWSKELGMQSNKINYD